MICAEHRKDAEIRLFQCLETECLLACEEGLPIKNVVAVTRRHLKHLKEVAEVIERKSNEDL